MKGQLFTVNSRKYDFSLRRSWKARLLERSDELLLLEGFFEHEVKHPNLGTISKGTRSLETFFFDRWYNYFVFYEPTGELRNYYINLSMPPQISEGVVDYVDLEIDMIIWPDRRIEILDTEEFEENAGLYNYPDDVVRRVLKLKDLIVSNPTEFVTLITPAT